MKQEKIQEFTIRISQANKSELIVILYDIIAEDINAALTANQEKDTVLFSKECRHAQRTVHELMASLDYQYEISYDLLSLYSYFNKTLIRAYVKMDAAYLREIYDLVLMLREAFKQVSSVDSTRPVMDHTQKIYAGLTYGRDALHEACISDNVKKRGFTV